jgi:c-di-GMP-binding flagellar brake protein YcgR
MVGKNQVSIKTKKKNLRNLGGTMYPKVNQTIIINTVENTYKTIVAEILDQEILIGYPVVGNHVEMLPVQTKLEISFVSGDNQYKFQSEIIGRKKDNISLYRIKKPQENEVFKVQRRENFRVSANLALTLKEKNFTTTNISGGGLLFTCPAGFELKEKEEVACVVMLPSSKVIETVQFQAKVARISGHEDPNKKNVGLVFTVMEERSRTKIIQYCFERQRQIRLAGR